jgi:hypothetical protein
MNTEVNAMSKSSRRPRRTTPLSSEVVPLNVIGFQADRLRVVANTLSRTLAANGLEGRLHITITLETRPVGEKGQYQPTLHHTNAKF